MRKGKQRKMSCGTNEAVLELLFCQKDRRAIQRRERVVGNGGCRRVRLKPGNRALAYLAESGSREDAALLVKQGRHKDRE